MMTYRFDTLAFKKDELSKILQSIDATFSFDHQKICSEDVSSVEQIKPLEFEVAPTNTHLVKMDLFTISEATCLLSDYNHNEVGSYVYDDDFRENCISYVNVESLIKAGIRSGKLDTTFNEEITSQALKQFAFDKGFIIDGFNDNLSTTNNNMASSTTGLSSTERQLQSYKKVTATQKERLDKLRHQVVEMETDYQRERDQYKQQAEQLQVENEALKQRVFELENKNNTDEPDLLNKIMNPNDNDYYAPDLALAVQLYTCLYIDNPPKTGHTHSSSANNWLSKNTGYDVGGQSGSRVRELAAPLIGWNSQRDRKFKK